MKTNETIDNYYPIIKKILGPIEPQGESHTDRVRFENLKKTIEVTNDLIEEIISVARNKERVEYSMKLAGIEADKFITNLKEMIDA